MREKLMALLKNAKFDLTFPRGNNGKPLTVRGFNFLKPDLVPLFADYIIANGWTHLPCKAGDTVWFDTWKDGKNIGIQPHKIEDVCVVATVERVFGEVGATIYDWEFGKTVFLTKEEAEAALRKKR